MSSCTFQKLSSMLKFTPMPTYLLLKPFHRSFRFMSLLLCLFASGLLLSGCSDDDADPQPPTTEVLLAGEESKTWMIESYTVLGFVQAPEACAADDELVFYPNNSLLYKGNEMKCEADEPMAVPGMWELEENEEFINITAGPLNGRVKIEDLTQQRLQVSTTDLAVPIMVTLVAK